MNRKHKIILAGLMVVHFVVLALLLSRNLDFLFNDTAHRIGPGTDFWALYNAGKQWLLENSIYGHGPGFGYRWHPIFAQTVMALISRLGYDPAYWLWVAVHEFLFLSVLVFVRKLVADTKHFFVITTLAVCFTPYYLEVYMGNASFLVAALLVIAFYLYESRRYNRFYFVFLSSVLVKPIGLVLLPVLLVRRHFRMVFLTCVILAGLAVPYFLLYPVDWQDFVSINLAHHTVEPGFLVHGGNQGLHALLVRLGAYSGDILLRNLSTLSQLPPLGNSFIRLYPYLLVLLAAVVTYRRRRDSNVSLLLFVWSATYLLAYKDVWEHSYSFLVFGLLYLYLSREIRPRTLLIFTIGLALPTAFAFYDIAFEPGPFHDPDWHWGFEISLIHHLTKSIWLIVLYAMVIAGIFRSRRGSVKAPVRASESRA